MHSQRNAMNQNDGGGPKGMARSRVGLRGDHTAGWVALGLGLLLVFLLAQSANSQAVPTKPGGPDRELSTGLRAEIIDSVAYALNEVYVFPEVAKKMEDRLRRQLKEGAYNDFTSCREYARKLTEDLREISKDRHLGLAFIPDEYIEEYRGDTLTDDAKARKLAFLRRDNFGFKEVKVLEGNVGYIDLRMFSDATDAGQTAVSAMNFLAHTDAIIFDLRNNGGGSPSMIQLITSYLVDTLTHLNSFYVRKGDTTQQFYTHAWVPGPKLSHAEVYVLTSGNTFSGAEEFTYNLKNLKRATIIGETTGGGAHPVEDRLFANLNVGMRLPFGRAVNPITGTNWEGTGVAPHIEVPQKDALNVAHVMALKTLAKNQTDEKVKDEITWIIEYKQALLEPYAVEPSILNDYVGTYGPRTIGVEKGQLYYQRETNPKYKLVPMKKDWFALEDLEYFRVEFARNESGRVVKIIGHYQEGQVDGHEKAID